MKGARRAITGLGHRMNGARPRDLVAVLLVLLLTVATAPARGAEGSWQPAAQGREPLCASLDEAPAARARQLAALGDPAREALLALARSKVPDEVVCGVAGLAALGDRDVIPPLVAALKDPALGEVSYRLARWAAYLAGGPDSDLGETMLPVVDAVEEPAVWKAAGTDAIWFLGEVDHARARERLLKELDEPLDAAGLDAVIHALARQGETRARDRISTLGDEALRAKSGNATPEQAQRLGEVAFYQLALGPDTLAEGLDTLGTIALRDQSWVAAWAVHTLCARAVRRPAVREATEAHRQALVRELDRLGIPWKEPQGTFGCTP